MFRPLSQQAFRTVRRPFRLYKGPTSRWVHNLRLPYSGPPSYDTIIRRFSSDVDPQLYFNRKHEQEAKERGEFIDVHDIGTDPDDFDVLISDVKHKTLATSIAEQVGVPYLSKPTEADAKEVVKVANGYIYGPKDRTIIPFVVTHKEESRWVFFIIDSGCPRTYFSAQVSAPTCGRKF